METGTHFKAAFGEEIHGEEIDSPDPVLLRRQPPKKDSLGET